MRTLNSPSFRLGSARSRLRSNPFKLDPAAALHRAAAFLFPSGASVEVPSHQFSLPWGLGPGRPASREMERVQVGDDCLRKKAQNSKDHADQRTSPSSSGSAMNETTFAIPEGCDDTSSDLLDLRGFLLWVDWEFLNRKIVQFTGDREIQRVGRKPGIFRGEAVDVPETEPAEVVPIPKSERERTSGQRGGGIEDSIETARQAWT